VKFLHRVFVINSKNFIVDSVGVPQCVSKLKKTLRVDLTSIIVLSTRSTVQIATQRADLPRKVFFLCTRIRVESKIVKCKWKQQRSKVYVYYDVFKAGYAVQCKMHLHSALHRTTLQQNQNNTHYTVQCKILWSVFFTQCGVLKINAPAMCALFCTKKKSVFFFLHSVISGVFDFLDFIKRLLNVLKKESFGH
jgi:hypothetical protein